MIIIKKFEHIILGKHDHDFEYVFLLFVMCFFLFMCTSILIYVIYSRINKQIKEYEESILIVRYEEMFTTIMFEDNLSPLVFYYKDKPTMDDYHMNVLLRELIKLHKQLLGEHADKLRNYYINSGLVDYSIKRLDSPFWNIKALGVVELSQMNIRYAYKDISNVLKSKTNRHLIDVVQQGLIKLTDLNGLDLLVKQHIYISDWQQLKIIDMLKHVETVDVPDFSAWFNYDYVPYDLFACRLVSHYQQRSSVNKVIEKLNHRKESVKKAAIMVISDLQVKETAPLLKELYLKENSHIKIEILNCFKSIISENDIQFLGEIFKEHNYQLSKAAAYALKQNSVGYNWLLQNKAMVDGNHFAIINHVLDTRI